MQTDRLAIELNSSADPSKSTPHGDEGRFGAPAPPLTLIRKNGAWSSTGRFRTNSGRSGSV